MGYSLAYLLCLLLSDLAVGSIQPPFANDGALNSFAPVERAQLADSLVPRVPLERDVLSSCGVNSQIPDPQPQDSKQGAWNGWGADIYNNHWAASDAVIDSSNADSLVQSCQKDFTGGVSASPLVHNGVAYFPTWGGLLVALNYSKCKILWQTNVTDIIYDFKPVDPDVLTVIVATARTTPVLDGDTLFLGTQVHALALAIHKDTGKLIDTIQLSDHPVAIITMSPTFYNGRLFLGTSSGEESAAAVIPGYVCCTFIGSMNALSFKDERFSLSWTVPMAPLNSNFSGVAVWGSQPAIDTMRSQLFIATGNVYSIPPEYQTCQDQTANVTVIQQGNTTDPCSPKTVYQESVLALDLATGAINWVNELSPLDAWNVACLSGFGSVNTGACPANAGPDADFGMAPTFVPGSAYTPRGVDVVVVGQKNGNLYALTAQAGYLLWATATSPDGAEGGLIWGVAVDDQNVYFTAVNSLRIPYNLTASSVAGVTEISNSAWGAASLRDGSFVWQTPVPDNATSIAPPAVANDVVFTGVSGHYVDAFPPEAGNGQWVLLNKHTGKILRTVPLNAQFQGSAAAVHEYALFGAGYDAVNETGSFNVWKLGGTGSNSTR